VPAGQLFKKKFCLTLEKSGMILANGLETAEGFILKEVIRDTRLFEKEDTLRKAKKNLLNIFFY
jgi:hypothetical protein